jgi:hypothetical protein
VLTLFDILPLSSSSVGLVFGIVGGSWLLGTPGAIIGALIGTVMGFIVGRIPFVLTLRMLSRELASKTASELRADLRNPACLAPNMVLLELRRRGEDIRSELTVVFDLLVSTDFGRRGAGWAALVSAYPDLAVLIPDYRIDDPIEKCLNKTERLRAMVESADAPDPAV